MPELEPRLREPGPDGLVLPSYGDYCFTNVPGTVGDTLGVDLGRSLPAGVVPPDAADTVERVVVLLLDGLGLGRWRRDARRVSLLRRLDDAARVTPLTSTFPSATPTALVSVNTGRTPADHGLVGGNCYLREEGFVLYALPFARRGDDPGSAAERVGPSALHDGPTVHERLASAGLESHAVVPGSIVGTPFAGATLAGSRRHPYAVDNPLADGSVAPDDPTLDAALGAALAAGADYTYCYLPHVDLHSHAHGVDSDAYHAALSSSCAAVERALDAVPDASAERTLLVATADHGHVPAAGARTDLTDDPVVRDALVRLDGDPLAPTGGVRSAFLHLRDGTVERVRSHLHDRLDGPVLTRERAISDLQLFGPDPGERARERCGDLVCIPREGTVWSEPVDDKRSFHGGLDPREMLVPFAATRLSAL